MEGIRKALRKMPPSTTIKVLRKVFAMPAPAARLILNDVTRARKEHKPWIKKVTWNLEWKGCWIGEDVSNLDEGAIRQRIDEADVVFFNVHGGGFRLGTPTMYMDAYISWIKTLKLKYGLNAIMMSADYRLAPEHRYPSPVEDIVRAYEYLTRHLNVEPYKIITIGDSAGAALILEMLFITHDPSMFEIVTEDTDDDNSTQPVLEELPRPAGSVMISPLVTDETTSESWKENVKYDYVSQYTAKVIKKDYFEPLDPDTPPDAIRVLGIAKLTTGFTAFLPKHCLFYVGDKEVLRDDALDVANKARDDGVDVETVMEDCVHDWFCVREVVKDKKVLERADDKLADFIELSVREAREEHEIALKNAAYDPGLESVLEVDEDIPEISLESKENDSGANGHHNMALAA
ncbi:hypothetical protein NQZ79_g3475 [Umbelopsis isabellina]|nr:hypothetical protein NQZ79_g3475 [Umbelopsis isabellina]